MIDLAITEGISGTWFFHLSPNAPKPKQQIALCGARVMHTNMPRDAWGTVTHIGERWCSKCKAIADAADMVTTAQRGEK